MHGIDTADQYLAYCPFIRKTISWPKKVFFYLSSQFRKVLHTISDAERLLKICSKFFAEIMKEGAVDQLNDLHFKAPGYLKSWQ
jgi:hypothetical protein